MIDFDIIVIDAKLTKDTDFTSNQKTAKKFSTYTTRSKFGITVNGESVTINAGVQVSTTTSFIKSFADENGVYKGLN
ncbi:MAG: hypothetical protein IPK35_09235 [Saprospiraceae bacterium]|jgi:hypothetical protein|nr:hypothetical protein [Saprospiraceae bacterium]